VEGPAVSPLPTHNTSVEPPLSPCHPDRSGGICSAPCGSPKSFLESCTNFHSSKKYLNLTMQMQVFITTEGSERLDCAL
jgi:hypothetical protein